MGLLLTLLACTGAPAPEVPLVEEAAPAAPLTVLAASSLTEALGAVNTAWAAQGHPAAQLSFDATSKLAKQVELGAPADLFFAADLEWMDALAGEGLLLADTRVNLLGNTLVAVVAQAGSLTLSGPRELAQPGLRRLALAGESVPAGRYARAALGAAGVLDAVQERVVPGDNVRTVLSWVAGGEADAGVVYATDARVEPRVRVAFSFDPASHPPIVYPAAALGGSAQPEQARAFLAFCQGPEARGLFEAAGFAVLTP